MTNYEDIINKINLLCLDNNGSAFETSDIIPPIQWRKSYHGRKSFFSLGWEPSVILDRECRDVENVLSKLPKGIQYKKTTILVQRLPDRVEAGDCAYENFATTYTIIVSEKYSKKFQQDNGTKQVLVSEKFDKVTLRQAQEFEKRISSDHPSLIELLSKKMRIPCNVHNTRLDTEDYGTDFKSLGMKPFSSEYQRLGLALALAKRRVGALKSNEFYYIECNKIYDEVRIYLKEKGIKKSTLKEW